MLAPPPPDTLMRELADALAAASFTAGSVADHLGPDATNALFRGEPGVVAAATRSGTRLDGLIRFLLLRMPATRAQLDELFGHKLGRSLVDASFVTQSSPSDFVVNFDVRPHVIAGVDRIIISDRDASVTELIPEHEHVLGVGAASVSLLSAAPVSPVSRVLDLGTGSGVQAIAQANAAEVVVATDVHPRALALAEATLAANHVDNVELRQGAWFLPVVGERFDRIVANPPFVVGLPKIGHVYRDSGLSLDGATELVVSQAADHLVDGGIACILGAWVHTSEAAWATSVASWLPPTGVSAWVLQRDVVDPGMYVSTWLKDESIDPRSDTARQRSAEWLDYFAEHDVNAVGFGWVFIQLTGQSASEVTAEELRHPFVDPLGPEAEEYFLRAAWLRHQSEEDILNASYLIRPGVAIEDVQLADTPEGMGFVPEVARVTRTDGPRFSHRIDAGFRAVLAGLHPGGLCLRDVVALLAASQKIASLEQHQALETEVAAAVVDLIRHGIVIPAELADLQCAQPPTAPGKAQR